MSSTSPSERGSAGAAGTGAATGAGGLAAAWTGVAVAGSGATPSGTPFAVERLPDAFGCSGSAPPAAGGGAWIAEAPRTGCGAGSCLTGAAGGSAGARSLAGAVAATAAAAPVTPESLSDRPEPAGLPFLACTSCSGEVIALCTRCAASLVA
ncbi:MAG TPA: hypothetical protein VFZ63_05560 [Jiangellaceae bacterium]